MALSLNIKIEDDLSPALNRLVRDFPKSVDMGAKDVAVFMSEKARTLAFERVRSVRRGTTSAPSGALRRQIRWIKLKDGTYRVGSFSRTFNKDGKVYDLASIVERGTKRYYPIPNSFGSGKTFLHPPIKPMFYFRDAAFITRKVAPTKAVKRIKNVIRNSGFN